MEKYRNPRATEGESIYIYQSLTTVNQRPKTGQPIWLMLPILQGGVNNNNMKPIPMSRH